MPDQGTDRLGFEATDPPFRRLAMVLVCGLIGVLIALAALALAPPRYRASAELALPSLAAAAAAEDAATSPAVLRTATAALPPGSRHVDEGQGLDRLRTLLARALSLEEPAGPDVAAIRSRVTARRSGERVVITVTDDDADDAAKLADAVARAVLAQPSSPAADGAAAAPGRGHGVPEETAHDQLAQARAEAEARGAAVRRADEALLVGLHTRLAAARIRTAEQRLRLAQIERLMRSGANLDTVSEVVQSSAIDALSAEVAEARRQERQAARVLGARHPRLRTLRDERRRAQRQITAELRRATAAVRQDLERAEAAERALSNETEAQRAGLAAAVEALTRLRELERTATYATPGPVRSEAPALAAAPSAGRLIAAAVPPARPDGLPPAALLGLGLAAGCGVGTAVAAARRRAHR